MPKSRDDKKQVSIECLHVWGFVLVSPSEGPVSFAKPKSNTFAIPSQQRMMFPGLMSR